MCRSRSLKDCCRIFALLLATNGILVGFVLGITYDNSAAVATISLIILFLSFLVFIFISCDDDRNSINDTSNTTDIESNDFNFDFTNDFNFTKYKLKYGKLKNHDSTKCSICSICLEDIKIKKDESGIKKSEEYFCYKECGHIYHEDCIIEWLKLKKNCPNCRLNCP